LPPSPIAGSAPATARCAWQVGRSLRAARISAVRLGSTCCLDRKQQRSATQDEWKRHRKTGLPGPPVLGVTQPTSEFKPMLRHRGQRHRARPARSPNVSNRAGLAALGVPSKPPAPAADCVHWWLAAPGSIGPANRRKRSTEEVFIRELRNSEVAMLQSLAQELATRSALGLEAHWDLKRTGT